MRRYWKEDIGKKKERKEVRRKEGRTFFRPKSSVNISPGIDGPYRPHTNDDRASFPIRSIPIYGLIESKKCHSDEPGRPKRRNGSELPQPSDKEPGDRGHLERTEQSSQMEEKDEIL